MFFLLCSMTFASTLNFSFLFLFAALRFLFVLIDTNPLTGLETGSSHSATIVHVDMLLAHGAVVVSAEASW